MVRKVVWFGLMLFSLQLYAQQKLTIKVEGEEGALVGATIETNLSHFLVTDANGQATLECACDSIILLLRYIGYKEQVDTVRMEQVSSITIRMQQSDQVIEEITIAGNSLNQQVIEPTSKVTFTPEAVANIPYLLGVQDPVKFIQLQSGVSTGTDGNNGYYVRGGGIDQNGIFLDHMELYNSNHLLGFFSMFNKNAIARADFVKSGYPAYQGGRLSSYLNLTTANPDLEKTEGTIGVGVLAFDGTIKQPIGKDKAGILVSYRRSYLDLITQNLLDESSKIRNRTDYQFSDLIAKVYVKPGSRSDLSLTFFTGGDKNQSKNSDTFSNAINWKTTSGGLNWKWLPADKMSLEFYANGGTYQQNFIAEVSSFKVDLDSYIKNLTAGASVGYSYLSHDFVIGTEMKKRVFRPNQANVDIGQDFQALKESQQIPTYEWSLFADDWIHISERLRVGLGARLCGFSQVGPYDQYLTSDNLTVTDTITYARGTNVASYLGFEPRIRASYLINQNQSLRVSLDRTYQYIHLSPLSSVSLPTDLWIPSTARVKPQSAYQAALGYSRIIDDPEIRVSVDGFGKLLFNQVEWKNGAIAGYSDSPNFDDDLIFGRGHSYGVEFNLVKQKGVVETMINYTLSRTMRQFDAVNNSKSFPAKYDRTHDLNWTTTYHVGTWSFSGLFKLASGTALTLPIAKYLIEERVVSEYSQRNGFRMPVYHRIDLSATLTPKQNKHSTWVFSVYNMYNRRNPYFIYFDVQGSVEDYSLDIDLKELSLFPILPSIAYEYSF